MMPKKSVENKRGSVSESKSILKMSVSVVIPLMAMMISIVAILVSCDANRISNNSNVLSQSANDIATEANDFAHTEFNFLSYSEPMALKLRFSNDYESAEIIGNNTTDAKVRSLDLVTTRGAVKEWRVLYKDIDNKLLLHEPIIAETSDYDNERKSTEIFWRASYSLPESGNHVSQNLMFSSVFLSVEDYQGNTELFMVVYVFDIKEGKDSVAQFIFDDYYLLALNQDAFSLPQNNLSKEEQSATTEFVLTYLSVYNDLYEDMQIIE
jgi:hypothetical protein